MSDELAAGEESDPAVAAEPEATEVPYQQLYANLMEEVKLRLGAIHATIHSLGKDEGNLDDFVQAESCLLQIRMICELIAISACIAHQPYALSKDILKSWNADRALKYLEEINEHCFPKTVEIEDREPHRHLNFVEGVLGRKELGEIYHSCGELLHRGMVKHFLEGKERLFDLRQIDQWARDISRLLSLHLIMQLEVNLVLLVSMNGDEGQAVLVNVAAGGPAVYEPNEG